MIHSNPIKKIVTLALWCQVCIVAQLLFICSWIKKGRKPRVCNVTHKLTLIIYRFYCTVGRFFFLKWITVVTLIAGIGPSQRKEWKRNRCIPKMCLENRRKRIWTCLNVEHAKCGTRSLVITDVLVPNWKLRGPSLCGAQNRIELQEHLF